MPATSPVEKPQKPTPDFPLFPHSNGQWAKKHKGKLRYFGLWSQPDVALERYHAYLAGATGNSNGLAKAKGASEVPDDFPLTAHTATNRWCKTINKRRYYFGPLDDWQAALNSYLRVKDELMAGRTPKRISDRLTIKELVAEFLLHCGRKFQSKELTLPSLKMYEETCEHILSFFPHNQLVAKLRPSDFSRYRVWYAQGKAPKTVENFVRRNRVVFNFAGPARHRLIAEPVAFGDGFNPPPKKVMRAAEKSRKRESPKLFTPEEILMMVAAAKPHVNAMILLGINCALGNHDIAMLTFDKLNLDKAYLDYPRLKTGLERESCLWPETVQALQCWLAERPEPKSSEHEDLVFLTLNGKTWLNKQGGCTSISQEMRDLTAALGINVPGKHFYALRHTLQTVAEQVFPDMPAIARIMGQVSNIDKQDRWGVGEMAGTYREEIVIPRIKRITDGVHNWLYAKPLSKEALTIVDRAKAWRPARWRRPQPKQPR